jgi:hypothetical protein
MLAPRLCGTAPTGIAMRLIDRLAADVACL